MFRLRNDIKGERMKCFLSMMILFCIGISQNSNLSGLGFYDYTYDLTENASNKTEEIGEIKNVDKVLTEAN